MKKKMNFIIVAFFCLALLSMGKVLYLQTVKKTFLFERVEKQRANPVPIAAQRGDIRSSDGSILATSVPTYNVYSDTRYINDIESSAKIVSDFFKLDYKDTLEKINSNYYTELIKEVSKSDIDEFSKIAPRGISYYKTTTRVYPNNGLLGNILGFVGNENKGLTGLEYSLNHYLTGVEGVNNAERDKDGNAISYNHKDILDNTDGNNVKLTINYDIQYTMQKEIQSAVEKFEAKSGIAVTMNPKTGEVLGIAEYPTLNPNNYKEYEPSSYKSKALSLSYEPGSTFKPVTVSIADALGVVDIENDVFSDGGSYYIGKHRIGNWGGRAFGSQTAREILMNSSNVGTVQIAMKIPSKDFNNYLKKFGFGTKTGIELNGEQNSIMFSEKQLESNLNKATNSFGQGIAVTPMQLMKAWAAIVNGGKAINPHILKGVTDSENNLIYSSVDKVTNTVQIIPESTSNKVKKMLQAVVAEGTGKKAAVPGYTVGGKTGTAQIVENGVYSPDKYRVSFLGFAPVEDPQVLTLVMLDSPSGEAAGGSMAGPSVSKIIGYSLKELGVKPTLDGEETDTTLVDSETKIDDYTFRLKSYIKENPLSVPYEFEGEGEIITKQHYESKDNKLKVIFTTESLIKDDYIIMPDLVGTLPSEFMAEFESINDKINISGDLSSPVSIQDNIAGSKVSLNSEEITIWTK